MDIVEGWIIGAAKDKTFAPAQKNLCQSQWQLALTAEASAGQRTGKFRLGLDHLIQNAKGESSVSREDFAIAIVDEIEKSKHVRKRFTEGYWAPKVISAIRAGVPTLASLVATSISVILSPAKVTPEAQ